MSELTREQLYSLAEDAFEVGNWARRSGMKKPQQLDEMVKAFRKTLGVPPEVEVPKPNAEERETK